MKRLLVILAIALALITTGSVALAQAAPVFKLGFKLLADQIPEVAGDPIENEWHNPVTGDTLQRTTTGLMVWRKADNWTAFTNGHRTWVNGPFGVMERPNEERFEWEAPAVPGEPSTPPLVGPPGERAAVTRVLHSVVQVRTNRGSGTGFAVAPGTILTNKHVVEDATTVSVRLRGGDELSATVAVESSVFDMALVRVEGLLLPPVAFAQVSEDDLGEAVVAVGYPLDLGGGATVTRGILSAVRVEGGQFTGEWIQTDAAVNPGNSGGPLVNLRGEVVGMVTWGIVQLADLAPVEGIKFALSANSITDNLPALLLAAGVTPRDATPATPELALEVGEFLQRYDEAEIQAFATLDASLVEGMQSRALQARMASLIDFMREEGFRQISRLVSFELLSAYELPGGMAVAEVAERWHTQLYLDDELLDETESDQPQIVVVRRGEDGWRIVGIQWLRTEEEEPEAPRGPQLPFSDWNPGPGAGPFPIMGVVDVPREGDRVRAGQIRIAGWALDPRAEGEPWHGIDELRAYLDVVDTSTRLDEPGRQGRGSRPDVAAFLGRADYAQSGFHLDVDVPVGLHTVHVFAHSTVSGWWYKSISIRVDPPPPPPSADLASVAWLSYPGDGSAVYTGIITNNAGYYLAADIAVAVRVYGSGGTVLAEGFATVERTSIAPGHQTTWRYHVPPAVAQHLLYAEHSVAWRWVTP
jgi:S1-C subfamily serine protease